MNPLTKKLYWAVCCGAVSYLPLSYQLAKDAYAQEATPLPTVTVTAPKAGNKKPRTVARRVAAPVRSPEAVPHLTPSTGTIGQPPAPYAGGQVGTTTRVGMLGNRNVFDTPFNTTGYTDKLSRSFLGWVSTLFVHGLATCHRDSGGRRSRLFRTEEHLCLGKDKCRDGIALQVAA